LEKKKALNQGFFWRPRRDTALLFMERNKEAMPSIRLRRLYELRSHRADAGHEKTAHRAVFGVPGAI